MVVRSELVLPVLRDLLGDGLAVDYLAADTPLTGSDYQAAHSDDRPLFAEAPVSLPGYAYVLNIPLVDFRLDNGPLEIWPNGSHMISGVSAGEASRHYPAEQVLMPAGSMLLWDTRMWHRGTPNNSPGMRPNLAVVYTRPWYRFGQGAVGAMPRGSARRRGTPGHPRCGDCSGSLKSRAGSIGRPSWRPCRTSSVRRPRSEPGPPATSLGILAHASQRVCMV